MRPIQAHHRGATGVAREASSKWTTVRRSGSCVTNLRQFPCTFSIEPMQVDPAVLSTKSTL